MFTQDFTHSDLLPFPTEGEGANDSVHKGQGWPGETVLFLLGDIFQKISQEIVWFGKLWEAS